jgi:ubiquinone/menaquinone biosynthesis C-methylase UbiE
MVLNGTKAWIELMKLGPSVGKLRKDIDAFFKGNIIATFESIGLFEFLRTPRSREEVRDFVHATDETLLNQVLTAFVSSKILKNSNGEYYLNQIIPNSAPKPQIFEDSLVELFQNYAGALPGRLQGKYVSFASGINLYDWDDALTSKMYTQVRKSAFAFADVTRKPAYFLDVGCGNGYATTAIWYEYFQEGHFQNGNRMQIFGIDPDENLVNIAQGEFARRFAKLSQIGEEEIGKYEKYFPHFRIGDVQQIPFEDNFFDVVYASQVLHWADPRKALSEMLRVTRPGGKVFGTENFYPDADRFNDLHFKVVEGAYGLFWKKDLVKWGKECGAKSVKIVTPISIFLIEKRPGKKSVPHAPIRGDQPPMAVRIENKPQQEFSSELKKQNGGRPSRVKRVN